MFTDKKFYLIKIYNNGFIDFFCRIKNKSKFLSKGTSTPSIYSTVEFWLNLKIIGIE